VDLTVAVPVPGPVTPTNGLVLGSLPAGTYSSATTSECPISFPPPTPRRRNGPPGHRLDVLADDCGSLWTGHAEDFLTDPNEQPNASKWVTEPQFKTA